MKISLFGPVLGMALATAAWGQTRPASVVFTYRDRLPQEGFRLGDECFVPVETLNAFGWTAFLRDGTAEVKVANRVHRAPIRTVGGRRMIPLRRVVSLAGAGSEWRTGEDVLVVFAVLRGVTVGDNGFSGLLNLPADPLPHVEEDPDRLVLDLRGARPDPRLKLPPGVRLEQPRPETLRLTIPLTGPVAIDAKSLRPSDAIRFDYRKTIGTGPASATPTRNPVRPLENLPPEVGSPEPAAVEGEKAPPVVITAPVEPSEGPVPIVKESESPSFTTLLIPVRNLPTPATFDRPFPDALDVHLPGVELDEPNLDGPLAAVIRRIEVKRVDGGTTIRFELLQRMGAEVVSDAEGVRIRLSRPIGNGSLAGRVVVVDAGHGGKDHGSNRSAVLEKTVALRVARELSAQLTAAGATVIMTRDRDVFIPLSARPAIANRNRADLFISCHINSTIGNDRTSGTITFFHGGRPKSELLAREIQTELVRAIGLPNIGVWSDKRIYKRGGFAVLRPLQMPGVLLELGFVNHRRDRARMTQPEFPRQAAEAVVRGIRNYLSYAP